MRSIVNMLVMLALVGGPLYYFFHDSYFAQKLLARFVPATDTEPLLSIYVRRLKFALDERQFTDHPSLESYFIQALAEKHKAMLRSAPSADDGKLTLQHYLDVKKREFQPFMIAAYDENRSGTVEQREWPSAEIFELSVMDRDKDGVLTFDEMWAGWAEKGRRFFSRADRDKNGDMSQQEYIAAMGGAQAADLMARRTDNNNNGAINLDEVNVLNYELRHEWYN